MSINFLSTILVSSLLANTATAFVSFERRHPLDHEPLSSELDIAHWEPIATLDPIAAPPSETSPHPTANPSWDQGESEYRILPLNIGHGVVPNLEKRQGAPAAVPVAPVPGQLSPITTYFVNSMVAPGVFSQVPVVYTQTFPPSPEPFPAAVAGTIGLGTIQGEVGHLKTKRSMPTQVPLAGGGESSEREDGGHMSPLMDKLRTKCKEFSDQMMELMSKKLRPAVDTIDVDAIPSSTEADLAPADHETPHLMPPGREGKMVIVVSDARRAFQASVLAILAVGFSAMCATHL